MTANEYALYYRGYFLRHHRDQVPFRRLFEAIINSTPGMPASGQIRSHAGLVRRWPLLIDEIKDILSDKEAMNDRWERALALTRKMKGRHDDSQFRHIDN